MYPDSFKKTPFCHHGCRPGLVLWQEGWWTRSRPAAGSPGWPRLRTAWASWWRLEETREVSGKWIEKEYSVIPSCMYNPTCQCQAPIQAHLYLAVPVRYLSRYITIMQCQSIRSPGTSLPGSAIEQLLWIHYYLGVLLSNHSKCIPIKQCYRIVFPGTFQWILQVHHYLAVPVSILSRNMP